MSVSVNGSLAATIAEEELRSELDIDEDFLCTCSGVLNSASGTVEGPETGEASLILICCEGISYSMLLNGA